jgi:hypothetical protein
VGTSRNNLAHTFTYFVKFEVLTTHYFESVILFKVDAMHMLVKTLCTCSCGMVLVMHVRMTRLPHDELVISKTILGREGI